MSATNHTDNGGPTIVVGWDGSAAARCAIAAAARLAAGGTIIAVHAHEEIAPHVTTRWQELLALDGAERSTELLREIPEAAIAGIERVLLEAASVVGAPAAALLRAARDHHADAIAVGSRGIGVASGDTGSVSAELLRTANLPVLVIPPAAVNHLRKPESSCTSRPPIPMSSSPAAASPQSSARSRCTISPATASA